MKNKILIIAPHPDDEVLGCGGIMHKYTKESKEVYVLVITRGTPKLYAEERIINVRKEALAAHKLLGIKETVFLDFHAPELDITSQAEISGSISAVIRKFEIDTLFIPHRGDIHSDHRVVYNASIVAGRPIGRSTVKRIYAYETLSETEWAAPFGDDAFIPTYFVNVKDSFNKKLQAMSCFKSQLKDFPNSRSLETIEALAKYRGATVGAERAEAFMTVRVVKD